ncbi:MAG: ABC transporter permease, partial [Sphaerospermopsis sp. SIO1G2]|nr:ABC transporter permease [Sphaerospermopsis sp. SIO1G2]
MNWWQRLKRNSLAKFGASVLLIFYVAVIGADLIAPYNPYDSQPNGSLLPPTPIHWVSQEGKFIGPHIYPTIQGDTNIETGDRKIIVDYNQPTPLGLFVSGSEYKLLRVSLPLPPKWEEVTI